MSSEPTPERTASNSAAGRDDRPLRPEVRAKFLFVGERKLYLRGVTYGTFRPDDSGDEFRPEVVESDFPMMAANGINTVRTYTVPPQWFLDAALRHGLRVMVGIPWEQHIAFLDDAERVRSIEESVRSAVRACARHPGVLCYVVGNEIPAPVVRWYGPRAIERFLQRLYGIAKGEDPGCLVTYVNYPTTEYLRLPFLDFLCFNVYLESRPALEKYLARLQNLADERPLVMGEIGLDSRRNGERTQQESIAWQLRTVFDAGCAGAFVFSWTDEWHRGGFDIEDWDFGLTTRRREPKPALAAVRQGFQGVPIPGNGRWPRISVVVCVYNGESTLRECLSALTRLHYPDFEVIVIDDGSKDRSSAIAERFEREHGFRRIKTENRGLSSARNTGLDAATGEIVAYIDSDAFPDVHWLTYLAHRFMNSSHTGIGGPNVAPDGDGPTGECVANAPGGPVHVLLSDELAEHIPGCNMAFRRDRLRELGGFDPRFRIAGDDVDLCWRVQQRGWTLGYSPGAMVWHHTRPTIRSYWKQQLNYGRAEALLERKWPEKYNAWANPTWEGRIYGKGRTQALRMLPERVRHGVWGTALFQAVYTPQQNRLLSLLLMPEWYLVTLTLVGLGLLGALWSPALWFVPLAAFAGLAPVVQAVRSAVRASRGRRNPSSGSWPRFVAVTSLLHLLQPLARLVGRLRLGLSPLRVRGITGAGLPRKAGFSIWSEQGRTVRVWLRLLELRLLGRRTVVVRGGVFDRWDLEARGGLFGAMRVLTMIEDHGGSHQLVRFRIRSRYSPFGLGLTAGLAVLALLAGLDGSPAAAAILALGALFGLWRSLGEAARAGAALTEELRALERAARDADRHASETVGGSTATSEPATTGNEAVHLAGTAEFRS